MTAMSLYATEQLYLRIFLSSPGDVTDERSLAKEVIERLRSERAHRNRLRLEIVAWDKPGAGTAMPAHLEPQEALNQRLKKPSDCDIVIVIFGYRMGTPLSEKYRKPNGDRYWSGTEYEYLDAVHTAKEMGASIMESATSPLLCEAKAPQYRRHRAFEDADDHPEWPKVADTVIEAEMGIPEVLVYRKKGAPDVNAADRQRKEKLEQWDRVEEFFAGFKNPDGSFRSYYEEYATPTEFKDMLDKHLREVIALRLEDRSSTANQLFPPSEKLVWTEPPYPGLRAFNSDEDAIFFGRDREIDELIHKLATPTNRFIAVVGTSGSGKSSLVAAGLLPRLQKDAMPGSKDWVLDVRFRPNELADANPFKALATGLKTTLEKHGWRIGDTADKFAQHAITLATLAQLALKDRPPWAELLLFINQFEELFSVVTPEYREPFIALLAEAAQTNQVRIVVTMRVDFYPSYVEWPQLVELLRSGSYLLAAPGVGALYEMITRPADRAGLQFEPGLVERILDDTGTKPGALALMAFALAELWKGRTENGDLTHIAYERFNGVQGAIAQLADNAFNALDPAAQTALSSVFRELVEVDERGIATRRRAVQYQLSQSVAAKQLIDQFTDARLLVTSSEGEQPTVEVAHEALLTSWPRLVQWIETVRDDLRLRSQLQRAAAEWKESGYPPAYLWSDRRVVNARGMLERLHYEPNEVEQRFLGPLDPERMLKELEDSATPPEQRALIGVRLALLSDPRHGVGLQEGGLPDIDWCRVPSSKIALKGLEQVIEFDIASFFIARFPVTWAQYQAFLEAPDGYRNPD